MTDEVSTITMFLVSLLSPPTLRSVIVPPMPYQGHRSGLILFTEQPLTNRYPPTYAPPHMAGHIRTLLSSSYS